MNPCTNEHTRFSSDYNTYAAEHHQYGHGNAFEMGAQPMMNRLISVAPSIQSVANYSALPNDLSVHFPAQSGYPVIAYAYGEVPHQKYLLAPPHYDKYASYSPPRPESTSLPQNSSTHDEPGKLFGYSPPRSNSVSSPSNNCSTPQYNTNCSPPMQIAHSNIMLTSPPQSFPLIVGSLPLAPNVLRDPYAFHAQFSTPQQGASRVSPPFTPNNRSPKSRRHASRNTAHHTPRSSQCAPGVMEIGNQFRSPFASPCGNIDQATYSFDDVAYYNSRDAFKSNSVSTPASYRHVTWAEHDAALQWFTDKQPERIKDKNERRLSRSKSLGVADESPGAQPGILSYVKVKRTFLEVRDDCEDHGECVSNEDLLPASLTSAGRSTNAPCEVDTPLTTNCGDSTTRHGNATNRYMDIPTTLRNADYDGHWARFVNFEQNPFDLHAYFSDYSNTMTHYAQHVPEAVMMSCSDTTDSCAGSTPGTSKLSPPPITRRGDMAGDKEDKRVSVVTFLEEVDANAGEAEHGGADDQRAIHSHGARPHFTYVDTWYGETLDEADEEEEETTNDFVMICPPCDPQMDEKHVSENPSGPGKMPETKRDVAASPDKNAKDKYYGQARGEPPPIFKTAGQRRRYYRDLKVKEQKRLAAEAKAAAEASGIPVEAPASSNKKQKSPQKSFRENNLHDKGISPPRVRQDDGNQNVHAASEPATWSQAAFLREPKFSGKNGALAEGWNGGMNTKKMANGSKGAGKQVRQPGKGKNNGDAAASFHSENAAPFAKGVPLCLADGIASSSENWSQELFGKNSTNHHFSYGGGKNTQSTNFDAQSAPHLTTAQNGRALPATMHAPNAPYKTTITFHPTVGPAEQPSVAPSKRTQVQPTLRYPSEGPEDAGRPEVKYAPPHARVAQTNTIITKHADCETGNVMQSHAEGGNYAEDSGFTSNSSASPRKKKTKQPLFLQTFDVSDLSSAEIGGLIGKKGANARDIREKTGANVWVSLDEEYTNAGVRMVEVTAKEKTQLEHAAGMVKTLLESIRFGETFHHLAPVHSI